MFYNVEWVIQIEADSRLEAAQIARQMQLDPESIATVFEVSVYREHCVDSSTIDLGVR